MKKVGIVIINYKDYAKKFLVEFKKSFEKLNYNKDLINIYIIDNASSDSSFLYLKEIFPNAKILQRKDGNYAAAVNLGFENGVSDGAEYLISVNMDVVFDENWLIELVKVAESDDRIGIVQSKILLYSGDQSLDKVQKVNSLGNFIHYLGFGFTDGYNLDDKVSDDKISDIKGYASGCSILVKKNVLDKIGNFNEEYYMYHDDLEFGWRAKLAGFEVVLANKSIVFHKYEFSRSINMVYFMERNRYISILSFYELKILILIFPMLLILEVAMIFYSIVGGWFKAKLKANLYFLNYNNWKKILDTRKSIKDFKNKEFIKEFNGKVIFQEIDNSILKYIGNPIMEGYWNVIKRII